MPEHRGSRAIRRMIELAPYSGSLALWAGHEDVHGVAVTTPVATDGRTISYGPGFEYLTLPQQMGLLAHELLHIALRHTRRFRSLPQADLRLFTICADAIVNSALSQASWLELPASSVFLDQLLAKALGIHQDVEQALREWDVERLYRAIDDRTQTGGDSGTSKISSKKRGGSGGQSDEESEPGAAQDGKASSQVRQLGKGIHADLLVDGTAPAPSERDDEDAQQWMARLTQCQLDGDSASILRGLIGDMPRSRVPWEQVLRARLARALAQSPSLSWSRPSRSYIANQGRSSSGRRMPFEPGRGRNARVPRIAVIVDVSGSIPDQVLAQFSREIAAISRRQEASLTLVIGDDHVRDVSVFAPGDLSFDRIRFKGGGGTDFTPLLEEADAHRPDIGVVLTDLDGPALFRPHWPVIWAVPAASAMAAQPFGSKLVLV